MIAEVILNDGEVISIEDKGFYTKILNRVPEEELNDYFLNRTLLKKIKENHNKTKGSCGLSIIQLKNIFSFEQIQKTLSFLQEKKQIIKREGINHELYFINIKNK
jgi:hypothetical protein